MGQVLGLVDFSLPAEQISHLVAVDSPGWTSFFAYLISDKNCARSLGLASTRHLFTALVQGSPVRPSDCLISLPPVGKERRPY